MAPKPQSPQLHGAPPPDAPQPPTPGPETETETATQPPKPQESKGSPPSKPQKERGPEDDIEEVRRCPICWGRFRGVGKAYHTAGRKTYYRCSRALKGEPCGHTWVHTKPIPTE